MDILRNKDDVNCFCEVVKYNHGELRYDESNESLKKIDRSVHASGEKLRSLYTVNCLEGNRWLMVDENESVSFDNDVPNSLNNSTKYLENPVNALVKEQEALIMVFRVFICDQCCQ